MSIAAVYTKEHEGTGQARSCLKGPGQKRKEVHRLRMLFEWTRMIKRLHRLFWRQVCVMHAKWTEPWPHCRTVTKLGRIRERATFEEAIGAVST